VSAPETCAGFPPRVCASGDATPCAAAFLAIYVYRSFLKPSSIYLDTVACLTVNCR
jgi:hypothetical protein